ncbi:MAG: hypothetical protein WCD81_04330 [Candidatus Bathyarchaeia archaeon]
MSKKDFDEIPRRAVNEGLSARGESVEQSVHFHAESSFAECIIAAESCFPQRNRIKNDGGAG